jgi:acyl-CoA synthetase (AMP-forming)/AMP-acid ligase II/carbon monoxide dehydrogenase subunit G
MRTQASQLIAADPEQVWELLADPANFTRVFSWVTDLEPEDPERDPGAGARYRMRLRVGSAEVGGLIEVVEYDEQRDLAWTSVTGIEQRGRIRLRAAGGGRTRVTIRLSYNAPGVVLGSIAELLSFRMVAGSLRRSLDEAKRELEGQEAPPPTGPNPISRLVHETDNVRILAQAGLVAPMRPDKLARIALAGARWRASTATGVIVGAIRHPDRPMVIDELGTLTYAEVDARSNAVANQLAADGVCEGDRIGLLCRDHRGFLDGMFAAGKLGADVLLLNTSFAAPQITEVCKREEVAALVYDEEFEELIHDAARRRKRFVAWREGEDPDGRAIGEVVREGDPSGLSPPGRVGGVTILTSGTTGLPKGAQRGDIPVTLDPAAALLERIPLHEGQRVRIAAPMFHAWGFANFALGMALGSTFVLRRRFDPEQCLRDIEEHRCEVLVVVPVMLQRILELPEETRRRYDTSSLRAVCASGSALPGDLATRWMDEFGENLYNLYGSTEVSSATLATPQDMRAAPGTAGKPTRGSIVRLLDEDGSPVQQGETGRIFVGNAMLFAGYTGGGGKDQVDGMMSTGDVGRFDEAGRLFVQGRDDEMIVSGGENVFPKEVEDLLARHDAVAEAAAIGVDDDKFGQRLRAFVVLAEGKQVSESELKEHVKSNLARYKVPREVLFLDELPRNPTGKVLKRELAEIESE